MASATTAPGNQQANAGAGRIRGFAADGASSSALYVGDLERSVDEGLLYHLFSRVCKDLVASVVCDAPILSACVNHGVV